MKTPCLMTPQNLASNPRKQELGRRLETKQEETCQGLLVHKTYPDFLINSIRKEEDFVLMRSTITPRIQEYVVGYDDGDDHEVGETS